MIHRTEGRVCCRVWALGHYDNLKIHRLPLHHYMKPDKIYVLHYWYQKGVKFSNLRIFYDDSVKIKNLARDYFELLLVFRGYKR